MLGVGEIRDATGNILREATVRPWTNFKQRALDVAIRQINKETDLSIEIKSIEKVKYSRITKLVFNISRKS